MYSGTRSITIQLKKKENTPPISYFYNLVFKIFLVYYFKTTDE